MHGVKFGYSAVVWAYWQVQLQLQPTRELSSKRPSFYSCMLSNAVHFFSVLMLKLYLGLFFVMLNNAHDSLGGLWFDMAAQPTRAVGCTATEGRAEK